MLPGRFLLPILALCSVVAAVQPRPDRGLIREQQQQQTQWEQLPADLEEEDFESHRFLDSLSSQEMSCPSKPQEAGEPKNEWPELVGKTADDAKAALQKEAPGFTIQVIGPDMMATADYRCERIRIWLGKDNRVSQPPRVG